MIFLTVGTQFPFDRLVRCVDRAVADGLLDEEVVAQIGESRQTPRHMEWVHMLNRDGIGQYIRRARAVIGHAGIGTILMALEAGKPLLVMPRLRRFDEHVNDHQVDTARAFEAAGHVLAAYAPAQVPIRLKELTAFCPKPRRPRAGPVIERVDGFLASLAAQCGERP